MTRRSGAPGAAARTALPDDAPADNRGRRRSQADVLGLLALLLLFGVAAALVLQPGGRGPATPGGVAASIASAAVPAAPSIAMQPTASPTPTATPRPTARPTPRPTPTPRPPLTGPAAAVLRFYELVVAHDWEAAIAMWSPAMQERYPPQQWLIDRFRRTTRIDVTRLHTVFVDDAAGRARVEVTLVEYRTVEPSPRTFSGAWDLVFIDGRWLLDDPHF